MRGCLNNPSQAVWKTNGKPSADKIMHIRKNIRLGCGFNPFETFSQIGSCPQGSGWKWKKMKPPPSTNIQSSAPPVSWKIQEAALKLMMSGWNNFSDDSFWKSSKPSCHRSPFLTSYQGHDDEVSFSVILSCFPSWWFQPIWNIFVKMGIFPR